MIALQHQLGYEESDGLPFFYAFTGCDSVSSFFNHGKCKFFDTWMKINQNDNTLTEVFQALSNKPLEITPDQFTTLEKYIIKVYNSNVIADICLNRFRMNEFLKSACPNLRNLIMSRKGLIEHTKRACLQAGWLWRECEANISKQCPTDWGWIEDKE